MKKPILNIVQTLQNLENMGVDTKMYVHKDRTIWKGVKVINEYIIEVFNDGDFSVEYINDELRSYLWVVCPKTGEFKSADTPTYPVPEWVVLEWVED